MSTATQSIRELMKTNLNELKTSGIKEHLERVNEAFDQVSEEEAPIRREYNALKAKRWTLRNNDGRRFTESPEAIEIENDMEVLAERINELVNLKNQLREHRTWTENYIEHRARCIADRERMIAESKARIKETTNTEEKRELREKVKKHKAAVARLQI